MALNKNKTYVRKPYDKNLYKWSPQTDDKKAKKIVSNNTYYCNANPYTKGEDWIVTYVYELTSSDGIQHRYAYVACDYVR